jgi:hypothetical protein
MGRDLIAVLGSTGKVQTLFGMVTLVAFLLGR